MIPAHIEIHKDDDHRWLVRWTKADGTSHSKTLGSRLSLLEHMPTVLAEVRGIPFPSIDMTPDETITIGTPNRRRTD